MAVDLRVGIGVEPDTLFRLAARRSESDEGRTRPGRPDINFMKLF
jgi:hypothetical protein